MSRKGGDDFWSWVDATKTELQLRIEAALDDDAREAAEAELRYFLHGPMAMSRTGKPKFATGVEGMKRSRPRPTAREAWEDRFLDVLMHDAVDACFNYFTAEADPLPPEMLPLPLHVEPTVRGLYRLSAVSAIAILFVRNGPITRSRLQDAYRDAYALIDKAEKREPEIDPDVRWHRDRVRAFDLVAAATGKSRQRVAEAYKGPRNS
jgi:hypothetical protein